MCKQEGTEWDGPLVLNALLVVAERYSALKRARFGSETSASALQGMCVLLHVAHQGEGAEGNWRAAVEQGVPGARGSAQQGAVTNAGRHVW